MGGLERVVQKVLQERRDSRLGLGKIRIFVDHHQLAVFCQFGNAGEGVGEARKVGRHGAVSRRGGVDGGRQRLQILRRRHLQRRKKYSGLVLAELGDQSGFSTRRRPYTTAISIRSPVCIFSSFASSFCLPTKIGGHLTFCTVYHNTVYHDTLKFSSCFGILFFKIFQVSFKQKHI